MADQTPDFWKKLEILLAPVGGLLTALSVAIIGSWGAYILHNKQETETRTKVYAELMSQREQAETVMRKDMFAQIIDAVLKPEKSSPDLAVLNLELLAYNFHESLNLKPLFAYVRRHLGEPASATQYVDRLERVAREVTRKQLLVLEEAGQKFDCTIDLTKHQADPESQSLTLHGITRIFRIDVQGVNPKTHEVEVRLAITTLPGEETKDATFTVGFYDFPMIDNTRLSADQRCAIVLQKFHEGEDATAQIRLVYFPGSRAGLREKTFSEDIIRNLE